MPMEVFSFQVIVFISDLILIINIFTIDYFQRMLRRFPFTSPEIKLQSTTLVNSYKLQDTVIMEVNLSIVVPRDV